MRNIEWQWSRVQRQGTAPYADIEDKATSATYIPLDDDKIRFLKATAMYTDGHGSGKEASEMSAHASQRVRGDNSAPGVRRRPGPGHVRRLSPNAEREVPENADSGTFVGDPVTATDDDDDTLTYTLWDTVNGGTTGDLGVLSPSTGPRVRSRPRRSWTMRAKEPTTSW